MKGLSHTLSSATLKRSASDSVSLIVIIWKSVSYDSIIDEIAKKSTDVVPLCQLVHSGSVISWTTIYNITHFRVFVYYLCDSLITVILPCLVLLMFCYLLSATSSNIFNLSAVFAVICPILIRVCLKIAS